MYNAYPVACAQLQFVYHVFVVVLTLNVVEPFLEMPNFFLIIKTFVCFSSVVKFISSHHERCKLTLILESFIRFTYIWVTCSENKVHLLWTKTRRKEKHPSLKYFSPSALEHFSPPAQSHRDASRKTTRHLFAGLKGCKGNNKTPELILAEMSRISYKS